LFTAGDPNFNQSLRVVRAGGDVVVAPTVGSRALSILAVAAQFGSMSCVRCLLAGGARVGKSEVEAAFRCGNAELMRLLWDAFPRAEPLGLAFEVLKSWNAAGLRWLLNHKIGAPAFFDLFRLFKRACWSGSYSCASSVLGFNAPAASLLRLMRPVGFIGRVLCGGLQWLTSHRGGGFIPECSMAAAYSDELREWLPDAMDVKLVAKHEGHDAASVKAFIGAAKGRPKTLTFVQTENGGSICGGYLDVAWVEGGHACDPGGRSFIFTLKNHLGVPPMAFWQKRGDRAAYMSSDRVSFGDGGEGFAIWPGSWTLGSGPTYMVSREEVALFNGDGGGAFHAARWELWAVM
jgi:hypothetical protein